MSEQPLLSQSPNPRPKISAPPPERAWTHEQRGFLVHEYNAMIDEIEHLSAHIVHLGGHPSNALPGESVTAPERQTPATIVPADIPQQVGPDIPVPADGTPSATGVASNPAPVDVTAETGA